MPINYWENVVNFTTNLLKPIFSFKNIFQLSNLSHQAICSISNETDIFCVDQHPDTGKLFVKFYPLTFDPDDSTVYVVIFKLSKNL